MFNKDAAKKKLQNLGFSEPEIFEIQYMDLEVEVIFAALKLREEEAALLYPIQSPSSLPEKKKKKKKKKMSWVAFGLSMALGAAAPWVIPNFLPDAVEQHQEEDSPSCPPWAGDDAYRGDIDC